MLKAMKLHQTHFKTLEKPMNLHSLLVQTHFVKKSSVQANESDYVDTLSPKAVKVQPRKRLKKRKETEVAVGSSRKQSCSFCHQIGHEILHASAHQCLVHSKRAANTIHSQRD